MIYFTINPFVFISWMAAALQRLNRLMNGGLFPLSNSGETSSNGPARGATSYPGDHHDDDAVGMCSAQALRGRYSGTDSAWRAKTVETRLEGRKIGVDGGECRQWTEKCSNCSAPSAVMNVPGARQETPEPSTLSKRMPVPTTAYQERVHRKIRPSTGHSTTQC